VETTAGWVGGWLNWGFHDHPESRDVSELTGLLRVDGATKAWGREFAALSRQWSGKTVLRGAAVARPEFNWVELLTDTGAGQAFRERYYQSFRLSRRAGDSGDIR
jgi:hypothetical protein